MTVGMWVAVAAITAATVALLWASGVFVRETPIPNDVKLVLTFDADAYKVVEDLRILTEKMSVTHVVNSAISTYYFLQLAIRDGKSITIIDNQKEEIQEVDLP